MGSPPFLLPGLPSGMAANSIVGTDGNANLTAVLTTGSGAIVRQDSPFLSLGVAGQATGQLELSGLVSGLVTIKGKDIAGIWSLTLPDSAGLAGEVLTTDGFGVTSWQKVLGKAVGGGTDEIFWENDQIVTTDYAIPLGKNAMTAGPVTVGAGVTVTVPSGAAWTVV